MSKTRDNLIEVARQLFAKSGVDNTTMNDIAQASKKGRRTLYTYFKNKKGVYHAVIASELDKLYIALQSVVDRDLSADEKLLLFINVRFEILKEVVFRNGTLRGNFFRDIWRVENVRKDFDLLEIEFIKNILDDGVDEDLFAIPNSEVTAEILHHAFKGLEVPYIRGIMSGFWTLRDGKIEDVIHLLFNGIKKNK